MSRMVRSVDLEALYDIFDVPEEAGPGALVAGARRQHPTLPHLILSAAEHCGTPMSDAALGELRRAQRRARLYRDTLDRIAAQVPVRALKGTTVARHYPEWLFRPQGDLDLLVDGEQDLWRVVRLLAEDERVSVGVCVLGAPDRHTVAVVTWPGEDNLLDPDFRVEVVTAALVGDFEAVPIRVALPEDDLVASLLALAEERFQRPFHARDAIDLHVMGRAEAPMATAELAGIVEEYRLAPEALELVEFTADRVSPGWFGGLGTALESAAERELALRAAHPVPAGPTVEVPLAVADGTLLQALPLRRVVDRGDWDVARTHVFGDNVLLLTPVGDYLLVTGELVEPERYEAALAELENLAEESR
jgi:hypothetical protein